jgi:hypothetical protein
VLAAEAFPPTAHDVLVVAAIDDARFALSARRTNQEANPSAAQDMGGPCIITHYGFHVQSFATADPKRKSPPLRGGLSKAGASGYLAAPILNIFVPHVEHLPSVAGRPFFIVICVASFISRLVLHLTQ